MAGNDRFLGEWVVNECVYSPDSQLLGTVEQQRRLYAEDGSDNLIVEQHCQPSAELRLHPMGTFAGDFRFRLIKEGRKRLYLGPDVHGFGISFGDYLCGSGVWPRFAYNFRSWSIRLSETRQLTGGVFFRGASVEAVVLGVGQLRGTEADLAPHPVDFRPHGGWGQRTQLNWVQQIESQSAITRHLIDPESWCERTDNSEDIFQLQTRGSGLILRRNHEQLGMAVAYGPMLVWETHGLAADSTLGWEITDPMANQQFSIRQHFQQGHLVRLEGLHFHE